MRALLVTLMVFASLPFILRQPHIGIYVWSWLGYMNPHRLAYGFAADFPFAQIVAVVTMVAILFAKIPKKIQWTPETRILLLLVLWMFITTLFADIPGAAWAKWDKVWKVQLFVFLTLMLITTPQRLNLLIWVIALSLGFYGVKGGFFTINTGGSYLVLGPQGTFIGARGEIGTALNMIIPLLRYLQLNARNMWIKHGLTAAMILTGFAVIGTHSRGAFLGLIVVIFFLLLKSRKKFFLFIMMAVTGVSIYNFMPPEWKERMETIQTYEEDASAMGRIEAWEFAIRKSNESPIFGGGFEVTAGKRAAHSIYFQMLGEHGYVGLFLFLLLGFATWNSAAWIRKNVKNDEERRWMGDLAAMIQVGLAAYASGGAFISQAYFDLFYHFVAVIAICRVMLMKEQAKQKSESKPKVSNNQAQPDNQFR